MRAVYYFSGSGHSLAVAEFFARQLDCPLIPIGAGEGKTAQVAVVVFPVYCQNIPEPVKVFLRDLSAPYVALAATYGRISYGNVLYEAAKLLRGETIAGAYIPMGHSFLAGDRTFSGEKLMPVVERIRAPRSVRIPRTFKNPLADIFPALRSRIGVRLIRTDACRGCGLCREQCPTGAIRDGVANSKCIRCLRCVTQCPHHALQTQNSRILDTYLKAYYKDEWQVYL